MGQTTAEKTNWQCKRLSDNVFEIHFPYDRSPSWESWVLLTSDRHLDHVKSDRKLQRHHLEQAAERGAAVVDFGDLFCAMQGKDDRRSSKSSLRHDLKSDAYLDKLIDGAGEFLGPYIGNLAILGTGNHETAVLKRCETDLTARLVERLNANGAAVHHGHFSGWIFFRFRPSAEGNGFVWKTFRAHYDHGYGGGGAVTKDVIQANRRAVYLPQADLVFSGHTHDSWVFPVTQLRVTDKGRAFLHQQHHVKIPSYKDEYGAGLGGWHVERGGPPKMPGAYWLRFYWSRRETIRYQILEAD